MDTFKIIKKDKNEKACSRSVRFDMDIYEKIIELSSISEISFNSIVNNSVRFAFDHLEIIDLGLHKDQKI